MGRIVILCPHEIIISKSRQDFDTSWRRLAARDLEGSVATLLRLPNRFVTPEKAVWMQLYYSRDLEKVFLISSHISRHTIAKKMYLTSVLLACFAINMSRKNIVIQRKSEVLKKYLTFLFGAGGGGRTRTSSRTRDFESRASANSTTPAEEIATNKYSEFARRSQEAQRGNYCMSSRYSSDVL